MGPAGCKSSGPISVEASTGQRIVRKSELGFRWRGPLGPVHTMRQLKLEHRMGPKSANPLLGLML
jgi:hypothetical protein